MPHVIHYEDDMFIVDSLVRVVADATRLEPDGDVLGDSLLATVRVADTAIRRLRDMVLQNRHLVERPEYIRLLAKTTATLAESLDAIIDQRSPMASAFAHTSDELHRMALTHRSAASDLRDMLRTATGEHVQADDLVSGDELSELLRIDVQSAQKK